MRVSAVFSVMDGMARMTGRALLSWTGALVVVTSVLTALDCRYRYSRRKGTRVWMGAVALPSTPS